MTQPPRNATSPSCSSERRQPESSLDPLIMRRRRRWKAITATIAIFSVFIGVWFALPIRTITVVGNRHLTAQQVQQAAGLHQGFSWLYYGYWRAKRIKNNPWIRSAKVIKRFPDRIEVHVTERVPFARWKKSPGHTVILAQDGVPLPGAENTESLILLQGWGPNRLQDALFVAQALQRYTVQSVAYTPSGVLASTAHGQVWSGDVKTLMKYAGAIVQFPNKQIFIYPWGVSVRS